jgi:pimeloyl-ACP methyl ester carboxylesterase
MRQGIDVRTPGLRHHVNGITLHCIEAGPTDGPLVILLHGFPEFWWGWRYQIEPLAEAGFRVLVPDQRGYNLSDKPEGRTAYDLDTLTRDIVGLADALGRETFFLVGHDWGGLVAWWTASLHPRRVAKLVAVNAPHPSIVGSYMRSHPRQVLKSLYAGFFQFPWLPETVLSADRYRGLRRTLLRTSRPGTFSDADLAHYEKAWSRPGALTSMLNWYRALPLAPRRRPGIRLPMPVLVIWGMQDQFLESGIAEASLKLCDRGTVRWIEKATHWVHLEQAEALNSSMIKFLERS